MASVLLEEQSAVDPEHPYFPRDILLPGYVPGLLTYTQILSVFGSSCFLAFAFAWRLSGNYKYLTTCERLVATWFFITGLIHFVIEGAVVVNSKFYQDTTGHILSEIWKEYAKADSRYATRDAFVIQMEGITAFVWGPACFAIFYGILKHAPWRYSLTLVVSLGQLYGDVLYYLTTWHVGLYDHVRPEPLYFWFYFIFMNFIWIVIPILCLFWSGLACNAAISNCELKSSKVKGAQKEKPRKHD